MCLIKKIEYIFVFIDFWSCCCCIVNMIIKMEILSKFSSFFFYLFTSGIKYPILLIFTVRLKLLFCEPQNLPNKNPFSYPQKVFNIYKVQNIFYSQ